MSNLVLMNLDGKPQSKSLLYHGSKGGLDGPPRPCSRELCDFGSAFYLGTNKVQSFSICAFSDRPVGYTCDLRLNGLNVRELTEVEWPLFVLYNRRNSILRGAPSLKRQIGDFSRKCDVVIGPIADDRIAEAFNNFVNGSMTFEDLSRCISELDLGVQYALKTQKACNNVSIISERELYGGELKRFLEIALKHREQGGAIYKKYKHYSRRTGMYIDEFVDYYKGGIENGFL